MKIKRIICVIIIMILMILFYNGEASAYTNHPLPEAVMWMQSKLGTYVDYDTWLSQDYWYQCTDLIYAYYDYLTGGVVWGNAGDFAYNELPAGWYRTNTPTQGDIVVWGYGDGKYRGYPNLYSAKASKEYGHVGIVFSVNANGTIDTLENNGDFNDLQGPVRAYTRDPRYVDCYIHPDWKNWNYTASMPSNLLNLGDRFYSYMIMSNNLSAFNVDGTTSVYLQQGVFQDVNQVWEFVRQNDGSYTIRNDKTGRYLDISNSNDYDGGAVGTFPYNGSNAQKYYLYGSQDNCVIRPACSNTRVLSVKGGLNSFGNNLCVWRYYDGETQKFNIWKLDDQVAQASSLNYSLNNNTLNLAWSAGTNVGRYNIIINTGSTNSLTEYKKIIGVDQTYYSIELPNGYYEVQVEGWNWFSHAFSNTVKFTIGNVNVKPFPDVELNKWYTKAVQYVKDEGLMSGYGKTTDSKHIKGNFGPDNTITRAEVATILYRMAGSPAVSGTTDLIDIKNNTGKWYYKAVLWCNQNGIINGYGSGANKGKFMPDNEVTRQDLAVMLTGYAKNITGKSTTISIYNQNQILAKFSDKSDISNYAKNAVCYMVQNNVISGKENGTKIDPLNTAKRAEVAQMIMQFNENIK